MLITRRTANQARANQSVMRVPSTCRNCANQAGCAGQAGAVTRLPSTCALSTAMSAYLPILQKVFGNEIFSVSHGLGFLRSLVLTRLFFNVHICVTSPRDFLADNGVYMRTLRRIAGDPMHSADVQFNDFQVRTLHKAPSIDCFIARLRLAYLGWIAR